ncbi:MAG: undecaprenyl-diphosphate phosphatase [Candidatus Eisenbacteria bacterium]
MVGASWFDVVVLAAVQGLTEFLPISSSGHLVLAESILHVNEPGVALEIVLHLGTLLAVVLYYRADLWSLLVNGLAFLAGKRGPEARHAAFMILWLVLGTLPAAIAGVVFGDRIEAAFEDPRFVCGALIVTGLLLLSTLIRRAGNAPLSAGRAFLVGVWQTLALLPGISRSGSTISGGMHLGIRPEEAARFSFLLSIPVILGAAALKARELESAFSDGKAGLYLLGLAVAFILGYVSIGVLLRLVRRGRFGFFGVYCLAVGIGGLVWFGLHR